VAVVLHKLAKDLGSNHSTDRRGNRPKLFSPPRLPLLVRVLVAWLVLVLVLVLRWCISG
jgi:hypothetical protein